MSSGEILTRGTVWITIVAYAAGAVAFAFSRKRYKWNKAARLSWTVACAALFVHVWCAFHFYHGWSHNAAYVDTARRTDEVFGLNWGGGLYVNYALLVGWSLDVIWWWVRGVEAYRSRPWQVVALWHGFLIFIIFNAAVIFGNGFARWAGLSVCLGLCLVWSLAARGRSTSSPGKLTVAKD